MAGIEQSYIIFAFDRWNRVDRGSGKERTRGDGNLLGLICSLLNPKCWNRRKGGVIDLSLVWRVKIRDEPAKQVKSAIRLKNSSESHVAFNYKRVYESANYII